MEPPSGLKFKILNENAVDMSWVRPSSVIEGYRIQVVSVEGQYGGGNAAGCRSETYRFCALKFTFQCWIFLALSDDATREFSLDAYTTTTSITDLTPDVDYSVSILSYYGSEESIPIFGQVTSK